MSSCPIHHKLGSFNKAHKLNSNCSIDSFERYQKAIGILFQDMEFIAFSKTYIHGLLTLNPISPQTFKSYFESYYTKKIHTIAKKHKAGHRGMYGYINPDQIIHEMNQLGGGINTLFSTVTKLTYHAKALGISNQKLSYGIKNLMGYLATRKLNDGVYNYKFTRMGCEDEDFDIDLFYVKDGKLEINFDHQRLGKITDLQNRRGHCPVLTAKINPGAQTSSDNHIQTGFTWINDQLEEIGSSLGDL